MALKTLVKISSVNNLSDARYGAGMGVEFMGFNLNKSSNDYISFDKFSEITNWVSGVKIVGEFGDSAPSEIQEALENKGIDIIQVDDIKQIQGLGIINVPIILRIDLANSSFTALEELLKSAPSDISYFLIESKDSGNLNLDNYIQLSKKFPIILDAALTIESLDNLISQSNIKGIALKGGNEIQPGIRDFDEMADILEFLEVE